MKIALFGGSFDPFHTDHLAMIKLVKIKANIDEVWIIPTNQNPFKTRKLSPAIDRVTMINLAINQISYVKVNLIELKNIKPSATYDTVLRLKYNFPLYKFYFMIGSDQLTMLRKWNNINKLKKIQTFIIFQRNEKISLEILNKYNAILIPFYNNLNLSSTILRKGKKILFQLPSINNYINNNLLYLSERLKKNMNEKRYKHCLNVGRKSRELALLHNLNSHKAYIAGVYHDITKQWSLKKQKKYLIKYSSNLLAEPIPTWHSYTAYFHLKNDLLFNDEIVLLAIKWHTVGHPKMTLFEMLIFVSDKISNERNYFGVDYYRKLAKLDLIKTFKLLLMNQIKQAISNYGFSNLGKNIKLTYKKWKDCK